MIGRVVSAKMKNTVVVLVERRKTHPKYRKSFVRTKKYLAHDEIGVSVGDMVEFLESRPISKNKFMKVTKVVGRDVVALGAEAMKEVAEGAIAQVLPEEKSDGEKNTVKVDEPKATKEQDRDKEQNALPEKKKRGVKKGAHVTT